MSIEYEDMCEKKRRELRESGQLTETEVEMEISKFLIEELNKLQAEYDAAQRIGEL